MTKTINIDGKEIRMRASALIPRLYRAKFGRDLIADLNKLSASYRKGEFETADLEVFENIAFLLCKQATPDMPETPEEWLDGFDGVFSIYQVLPEILSLWQESNKTTSTPAKK